VIDTAAAIEDDLLDASLNSATPTASPTALAASMLAPFFSVRLDLGVDARRRHERVPATSSMTCA
jgi:hypothetical protein